MPEGNGNGKPAKRKTLSIKAPQPEPHMSDVAADMVAPTEASIREVRARIEEAFFALGTDKLPGTIIPAGAKNNSQEAAEYLIADVLAKLATTRLKAAAEAADTAGVFGNKEDYVIGDTVMVFSDPNFSISVKMGKPGKMLDRERVEENAVKYLGKKASEFLAECQKPRAATKTIIVSMK